MITFLDLPREIRDMIYELALVSPTGQIVPQIRKSICKKPRSERAVRRYSTKARSNITLTFHPSDPTTDIKIRLDSKCANTLPLAVLLPAAHPQIYLETSQLFWSRNTVVFDSPTAAIYILKHMGQAPSRLIKRIHLRITPAETSARLLGKALNMLASRGRSGQLSELSLLLTQEPRQFCSCTRKGIECRALCQLHASGAIQTWMWGLESILGGNRDVCWKGVKRWIHMKGPPQMEAWGSHLAEEWGAQVVGGPRREEFKAAFPS